MTHAGATTHQNLCYVEHCISLSYRTAYVFRVLFFVALTTPVQHIDFIKNNEY